MPSSGSDGAGGEAANKCEAATWPSISGPIPFAAALLEDPASQRLFLDAEGGPFPSALSARPVILLVGPEGGWTDAERFAAGAQGWPPAPPSAWAAGRGEGRMPSPSRPARKPGRPPPFPPENCAPRRPRSPRSCSRARHWDVKRET